jgi:hypothetical protein
VSGIQVEGDPSLCRSSKIIAATKASNSVVLPPKRPALNGCVERAQSSWRYEFYACYDLPARIDKLQPLVDAFAH